MSPAQPALLLAVVAAPRSCGGLPKPGVAGAQYFGQSPPGLRPSLFAPGVVSTPEVVELNGVFSSDFSEFYFSRMTWSADREQVFRMYRMVRRAEDAWSVPEHVRVWPDDGSSFAVDMAISPDGNRLYFLGRRPHALAPENPSHDIWVSERASAGGWSLATPVPPPVWSEHIESYPSLAPGETLQFSSNRPGGHGEVDLWRAARRADGGFDEPVNMGPRVNSPFRESDSCVAPDASYIVFTSNRPGGPGNGDLYVSFREGDSDDWSQPVLLGNGINSTDTDYCPMVTPDGRYLFFSRRVSEPPDSGWKSVVGGDVHWIDARAIERLRP